MRNRVRSPNKPEGKSKYALKVERRKTLARKLNQPPNTPIPVLNFCVEYQGYEYVMDSINLLNDFMDL